MPLCFNYKINIENHTFFCKKKRKKIQTLIDKQGDILAIDCPSIQTIFLYELGYPHFIPTNRLI